MLLFGLLGWFIDLNRIMCLYFSAIVNSSRFRQFSAHCPVNDLEVDRRDLSAF